MFPRAALLLLALPLLIMPTGGTPSAAGTAGGQLRLQLKDSEGAVLLSLAVKNGFVFGIRFIHSVAQSPVEEWFAVEDGTIFLEKTVYQDFGAGLPHEPGPGQTMTCADGHVVISGYHRRLASFDVRVGRIARHTLLLPAPDGRDGALPLNSLAAPGSAVTFEISETQSAP